MNSSVFLVKYVSYTVEGNWGLTILLWNAKRKNAKTSALDKKHAPPAWRTIKKLLILTEHCKREPKNDAIVLTFVFRRKVTKVLDTIKIEWSQTVN